MKLCLTKEISIEHLMALYDSVGWANYTCDSQRLVEAVQNSTYVLSIWDGEMLVGLVRGLSDDVSIFYLQDILVHPSYQGQGIGRRLLTHCLERFAHVRQKVLLTDNAVKPRRFYESLGFCEVSAVRKGALVAYVRLDNSGIGERV